MESAEDLFSYFVMGSRGAAAFARDATVNTDDNVYLEFSRAMDAIRKEIETPQSSRRMKSLEVGLFGCKEDGEDELPERFCFPGRAATASDPAHGRNPSCRHSRSRTAALPPG